MKQILFIISLLFAIALFYSIGYTENWVDPEICSVPGYEDTCNAIKGWYSKVMQPDNPVPCCGVGDAYCADDLHYLPNGDLEATIMDARAVPNRPDLNGHIVVVPPEKIDPKGQGNPTGHSVIFMRTYPGYDFDDYVYCFFPNITG